MPNGDASGGRNWSAVPPGPQPQRSISLVIHKQENQTSSLALGVRDSSPANEASDIHQGTRQGKRVGQEVRGLAWCDSIRKRRSAFRPNALRIGHTTCHRNPTANCE